MIIIAPRRTRSLRPPESGSNSGGPAGVVSGVAVGVDIGWSFGGELVDGEDGGSVGDGVAGADVGVRVGTVCRSGLCPGAAHRSAPAINPTISTPSNPSPNMTLCIFIVSSPHGLHACKRY